MKFKIEASLEGLWQERAFPSFPVISSVHKQIQKQIGNKKYLIVMFERSCSNSPYAVFVEQGLLKKKYEYAENVTIDKDAFFAIRQFYYDCHAAFPTLVFNIIEIWCVDPSAPKFNIRLQYDQSMDVGGDGVRNSSLNGSKVTYHESGIANRNYSPYHEFVTKGETERGFKPLRQ